MLSPILSKIVRSDRSAFVRLNGWYALVWLGKDAAYNHVLQFLEHPYYRIRVAACNLILNLIESRKLKPEEITRTLNLLRKLIVREKVRSVYDAMKRCIYSVENLL